MSEKIIIIGASGFAKEVYEVLMNTLQWAEKSNTFIGFLDDNESLHGNNFMDSKVLGGLDWLLENQNTKIVLGIGSPSIKSKIVNKISKIGDFEYITLIDSNVVLGKDVRVGKGVFIGAGTVITTNIDIEDFVTINLA